MRSFACILILFAASLVVAGILAYPVWALVDLIDHRPIHRVMHRVAMLCALIGLLCLFRRWRLLHPQAAGFGLPRHQFWRQLAAGLTCGALIILPLLVTLQTFEVRVVDAQIDLTAALVVRLIVKGLLTGIVVALIEEIFFRGLLFTAIERESGRTLAILLPSLLFASLHFLNGGLRIPADEVEWTSGLEVLSRMFIAYADPVRIADSFLALFAVGVLLALIRAHTGGIAVCIGMHAAWVCAVRYYEVTTQFNPNSAAGWLVGSYDGVVGWATVAWMFAMASVYLGIARTMRTVRATAAPSNDWQRR